MCCRYHLIKATERNPSNFDFLVELAKLHQHNLPRTLVFFNQLSLLTEAYNYVREEIGQKVGDQEPLLAMFSSLTAGDRKAAVLTDLNNPEGAIRIVFCTSSLAVGINVSNIKLVVHYGAPKLAQDFLQETGRAAREQNAHAHSILMTFPKMNPKGLSDTMKSYTSGETCRRQALLKPFSSTSSMTGESLCCDICNPTMEHPFRSVLELYFTHLHASTELGSSSSDSVPSLNELNFDESH